MYRYLSQVKKSDTNSEQNGSNWHRFVIHYLNNDSMIDSAYLYLHEHRRQL